jgi:hypothetical protein
MLVETKRNQVFQISPSVRVVADYEEDYDTIDQVARNIGLGVQTLQAPNNFTQYSTDDDYSNDIQAIIGMAMYNYAFEDIQGKVSEFLTNQGVPFIITTLKGFSQGESSEVVIYDPKKEWDIKGLESVAEELDARFAGEVYRVSVEYAKVFTANDGETRTEWITDEDLGYYEVVEKLFTLNADYVKDAFGFEVVIEVEG